VEDPDHDLTVRVKTLVEQVLKIQESQVIDLKETKADIKTDLAKLESRMASIETKQAVMDSNCVYCRKGQDEIRIDVNARFDNVYDYIEKELKAMTDGLAEKEKAKKEIVDETKVNKELTKAQIVAIAAAVAGILGTFLGAIFH